MSVAQWIGLALILIAIVVLGALIYGYRSELEELAADLDEARDETNGLHDDQKQAEIHAPIWCPRCGEYRALPHLKYCPVCLDIEARKDKR